MSTSDIYARAFHALRATQKIAAARYSLRRALFGLGPTGFPFERYLAELFVAEGYEVKVGGYLHGKCVRHEIDIAAYRADHAFVAEAKFHSRPDIKSDLQTVMYAHARKLDLVGKYICADDTCGINDFFVVTNTKFTTHARRYAACVSLKLLSWDFPVRNTLYDRIRQHRLYPITVLQELTKSQKQQLISKHILLCRDVLEAPRILTRLKLSKKRIEAVKAEARQLCAE